MEVQEKRKGQKTRLQMDQDFKQKKIFDLNKKYNIDMFSTAARGGKAFASEQKSKELKKGIFRLKVLEKRIKGKGLRPYEIIKKSVENMNAMPSAKYKQTLNKIEKKTLSSEADKEKFNFPRLENIGREKTRKTLRSPLEVGEEVFTKVVWITSPTFIIKRHFRLETDKKLKKNIFTG